MAKSPISCAVTYGEHSHILGDAWGPFVVIVLSAYGAPAREMVVLFLLLQLGELRLRWVKQKPSNLLKVPGGCKSRSVLLPEYQALSIGHWDTVGTEETQFRSWLTDQGRQGLRGRGARATGPWG